MGLIGDKISSLTKQLFPTGRAFFVRVNSYKEKYLQGLQASEERAYNDAVSILNGVLPDNDGFTVDDASAWETRLGLITNSSVPLADRKLAIERKMNHPGTIKPRQNYLYLQNQLQAAGFDVFVYRNVFDYGYEFVTKTPSEFSLLPYPQTIIQHKTSIQHGQVNHGYGGFGNKVANYIEQTLDDEFYIGSNYRFTFFIGGSTPGSWATVDADRESEFRQLILKIKPVQSVAFLLCNFS